MTQDIPLNERGLEAAREQHGTNHDGIIRAYLQTAAADVSGLVERLNGENPDKVVATDRLRMYAHDPDTFEFDQHDAMSLIPIIEEAATTLQTLSASNAALEAENERLRVELKQTEYLMTKDSFSAAERLSEGLAHVRQARAALSTPKGGQDE